MSSFVAFKDSIGSGLVVPDRHGGTKLSYLRRYATGEALKALDGIEDEPEPVIERVDIEGLIERVEPDSGSH